MNGVFAVAKPGGSGGPTSQDIVGKLKKIFSKSPVYLSTLKDGPKPKKRRRGPDYIKIGHGGTLDPLADGVLVVGVGTGTKQLQSYLGNCTKRYASSAMLGSSTTTYDSEGAILGYKSPAKVTDEDIQGVLDNFRGKIQQLPPVFSALKMDGKPLYQYAREGIPLPRPIDKRECEITTLNAGKLRQDHEYKLPTSTATAEEVAFAKSVTGDELETGEAQVGPVFDLTFDVSSGTYIRSLIHDIGRALDTQAHMVKLTRVQQADWELGKNVLPVDLFDKPYDEWWPILKEVLEEGPKRTYDAALAVPAEE